MFETPMIDLAYSETLIGGWWVSMFDLHEGLPLPRMHQEPGTMYFHAGDVLRLGRALAGIPGWREPAPPA